MKHIASLLVTVSALIVTTQAHAVMPSDAVVNRVNRAFRTNATIGGHTIGGGTASPQLGSGGGGDLNPICTGSPENATVLLAIISGLGLVLGRGISRGRSARLASLEAV